MSLLQQRYTLTCYTVISTTPKKQTTQKTAKPNFPGSVAVYDTQLGTEVILQCPRADIGLTYTHMYARTQTPSNQCLQTVLTISVGAPARCPLIAVKLNGATAAQNPCQNICSQSL